MALAKLSIEPEVGAAFDVMFNPNSYTITKGVAWTRTIDRKANAPVVTFGGGGARELTLELFFDVTESRDENRDVRSKTDDIVWLTRILRDEDKLRPPICTIKWGAANSMDFPFDGVVSNLTQRFTLFSNSGRPLRATLNVTFTEFVGRTDDLRKTDPELTTHTVRRGDTLSLLAAKFYLDPADWRRIADANRITNPDLLPPGTILTIPGR